MSPRSLSIAPIIAFGDLTAGVWGVVVVGAADGADGGSGASGAAATASMVAIGRVGGDARPVFLPCTCGGSATARTWTLSGSGHSFTIAPVSTPTATPGDGDGEGLERCRLRGTIALDGEPLELDCSGVRSGTVANADSLRLVATWFPDDVSIALRAVRPPGAKGHDRDAVAALLHDAAPPMVVFDPRLSTTHRADGMLTRMGVELWLGASEDDDLLPRRAAGETVGAWTSLGEAGRRLDAHVLRCQSGGAEGTGVFVLAGSQRA